MSISYYTQQFTLRARSSWQKLYRNWLISFIHKSIFIITALSILLIVWKWQILPPRVPLWYSRPWGMDQLVSSSLLFLLPLGSIIWYGIDFLLAIYVTDDYLIFTQALFSTAFMVSLLSFITLAKIIFLVT